MAFKIILVIIMIFITWVHATTMFENAIKGETAIAGCYFVVLSAMIIAAAIILIKC